MMSTYVITYVMQLLLRTVLQESKHEYLKTDYIDNSAWLPKIIKGTSVSLGIVIAVIAAIVIWFILYRTSMGYRIRVMGFNQDAAAMSGINPKTQCMLAFFISGAVAGLAGFTEINGMQHMLLTGLESDIGFLWNWYCDYGKCKSDRCYFCSTPVWYTSGRRYCTWTFYRCPGECY